MSQRSHRYSEAGNAGPQSDDLLEDFLALRWPFQTVVQAAGNFSQNDAGNLQPPENE